MKTLAALAVTATTLMPTLALADPDRPTDTIAIPIGSQVVEVWPYTTSDFERPSDPVNLVFPGSDPREIRQALMALDGNRAPSFPPQAPFNCTWTDAMGYEQAGWAETEGWVGAEIQLACVAAGAPLGNPFRFHIRLFRQGGDTLGNAHFEFLIPGTAEHEVLSWDLARAFVTLDMARTGALIAPPGGVPMIPAGSFRAVRRPVYDGLVAGGAIPILAAAGLYPTSVPAGADVPIPTNGAAAVLAAEIIAVPTRSKALAETDVTYDIVIPRPFCSTGPFDLVRLQGPIHFGLRTETTPSGQHERTYTLGGHLTVTPMAPRPGGGFDPVGEPVRAFVQEVHTARLSDRKGQVSESVAQVQLGHPLQVLAWRFAAGSRDGYDRLERCGVE
jgi:hypothetical protein